MVLRPLLRSSFFSAFALSLVACKTPPQPESPPGTPGGSQGTPLPAQKTEERGAAPKGCSPDRIVARFPDADSAEAKKNAKGFEVRWLYSREDIQVLESMTGEPGQRPQEQRPQEQRTPERRQEPISGDQPNPIEGGQTGGEPSGRREPAPQPSPGPEQAPAPGRRVSQPPSSGAQIDPRLVDELKRTYTLTRQSGVVTAEDLRRLTREQFEGIEFDCPILGMESTGPGAAAPSADAARPAIAPDPAALRWYEVRTGAHVVVPFIDRKLGGRIDPPVRVAVVDSGIDPKGVERPDMVLKEGADFAGGTGSTPWLSDRLGHGTAVASIIQRMVGPYAELVSVRVLDEQGRGSQSALAKGIISAVADHRAQVVNLSLGYHRGAAGAGALPQYLIEALATAYSSGARVFAAAGNDCRGPDRSCQEFYPAAAPWTVERYTLGVTSVSGLTVDGQPSSQVVTRPVDLWAPSEYICARTSPAARPGGYQLESGSSFAVPQVSGAFALLMAYEQRRLRRVVTPPEVDRLHRLLIIESGRDGIELSPGRPSSATPVPKKSGAADDGCATASHEGAFLHGKSGGRLNMCNLASALGIPVEGCTAWTRKTLDPALFACPVARPAPTAVSATWKDTDPALIGCCGYPPSVGYEPVQTAGGHTIDPVPPNVQAGDQRRPAVWCSSEVHSAPSIPICTSCQYCLTSSSQFRLTLQLSSTASSYQRYQLRITTGAGRYLYFPLGDLSQSAGGNLTYNGTFEPEVPSSEVSEAWLIATDRDNLTWTGSPLARTTCN